MAEDAQANSKWKALESNPEVLNNFARKLGLKEVYSHQHLDNSKYSTLFIRIGHFSIFGDLTMIY